MIYDRVFGAADHHLYDCDYFLFMINNVSAKHQTFEIEVLKKINKKANPFGKEQKVEEMFEVSKKQCSQIGFE